MLTLEAILIIAGWLFSLFFGFFVVAKRASSKAMEMFGLAKVEQDGRTLWAIVDPDGEPLKVPLKTEKDKDGTVKVVEGYAPLAWTLPYVAGVHAKNAIAQHLQGAKGGITARLNRQAMAELPLDQQVMMGAIDSFSKGKVGQGLMQLMIPKIQEYLVQQSQKKSQTQGQEGGFKPGL